MMHAGDGSTGGQPFVFRKRHERVDWRKIASVNIDSIARDLDFNTLQQNIMNITYCNIEMELDLRTVDPNFIKLFKLSQLTIEYLLHSQDYLSETILELECRLKDEVKEKENNVEKVKRLENDIERIKKEGHKRKKLLMEQQQLIDSGANNFHKCLLCPKAFMNYTFLQNHSQRRHGQSLPDMISSQAASQASSVSSKIAEELKAIKERLESTEEELAAERRSLRLQGQRESSILADREAEHAQRLEKWQEDREEQHKREIERMQNMLMSELREMQEKQTATQRALEGAQQGNALYFKSSNLGNSIRDDLDYEREMLLKQREDVARQQEELKVNMDNVQDLVQKQLEAEWKKKMADLTNEQKTKTEDLNRSLIEQEERIKRIKTDHRKELKSRDRQLQELVKRPPAVTPREDVLPAAPLNNEKKGRTLTFADEQNGLSPSGREISSPVPQIVEVPATESDESSSEEESEEEEEEGNGFTVDGQSTLRDTSTLHSTLQSQSSAVTSGTLDLTGKSKQLQEALLQNPDLMNGMKKQMRNVLQDELGRWGIDQDCQGISSTKLMNKLQMMSQERTRYDKKYGKRFTELRHSLAKMADEIARDKLAGGTGELQHVTLSTQKGTMSSTGGSSGWGTTSSKWSASERDQKAAGHASKAVPDDYSDSTDEEYSEEMHPVSKTPPTIQSARTTDPANRMTPKQANQRARSPVPANRSGVEGGAIRMPGMDSLAIESESDWDEEDGSELREVRGSFQNSTPNKSTVTLTGKPSGMIAGIASNIEAQLLGRSGKAPTGGINTLEFDREAGDRKSPATPEIPQMDNESDYSITSSDDGERKNLKAAPVAHPRDSVESTNTYASSKWGHGTSTQNTLTTKTQDGMLHPKHSREGSLASDPGSLTSVTGASGRKDSESFSDWSADEDFKDL